MRAEFEKSPDLTTLIDEWTRLYEASDARFFLSPPWIGTWVGETPATIELGCVRVFDDLRGVYGMALVGAPERGSSLRTSTAKLHESGQAKLDSIYLEYNDILLAQDAPAGAREAAIEAVIDALPRIDEFVFRNARAALVRAVEQVAADRAMTTRIALSQPTFEMPLGAAPVIDALSSSLRAKIRRSMRRYEERGPLTLERAENAEDRSVYWTELMRLHAQTWARRGKKGVFREPAFTGFHTRLIENRPEWIDLVRLTAGRETVGVLYNFVDDERVYNYQSGFLYEADNQFAPGFVSHVLAAERYREEGYAVYDMMGGGGDYKKRLGREGETLQTIVLTRPGVRLRMRSFGQRLMRIRIQGTRQT